MAGVSGTEVLYKRESKLGLTTLTFRKRRYLFPSVAHRDEHILSASTGDLQSRGKCVMLDVGLFCPHCAGAISARLSGSHSKLVVAKASHVEHKCIEAHCAQPEIEHRVTDHSASAAHSTTSQQWYGGKRHNAAKVKMPTGLAEETHLEIGFNSLDRHRSTCQSAGKRVTADKLSSSDYESLDRDAHINSWSSYDNSTGTFNSATYSSSLTAPSRVDDAYCSMTSSQHSNTQDSLHKMSNLSQKYSSLPRDVRFPVCAKPVSEEKLILDSMDVETSDKNEAALVEELLSDDVIDEEYQNLMNASAAKEEMTFGERKTINKSQEAHHEVDKENLQVDEASGACKSEDSTSERSASPETFVDDVLENIESEIYTGDATLPRVFALQREGSPRKHLSRKKAKTDTRIRKPGFTKGKDWPQNKTPSLKRNELHEFIKTVYNSSQKNKIIAQQDTDFSHETFFEEVVEALTDLESGFTTDWTSDYDSDNKCRSPYTPSPERARFHLGGDQDSKYKDIVDAYNIQRKTATSSCECIPDDRSRDLDSSTERISSTVETPSELSVGSVEGYGSSSECSYSGLGESTKEEGGLFEQLIENTKCLTEDLLVIAEDRQTSSNGSSQGLDSRIHAIPPDKRKTSVNDERARRDKAFLETGESEIQEDVLNNSMSANKGCVPVDVIRRIGPVPQIVEPGDESEHQTRVVATRHTAKSEDSDEDDVHDVDDLDISLENLLVCNAIHCSTSDLDEPYSAELRYVSRLEGSETLQNDEESMFLSDIQNRPSNKMIEVDEFVPEMDEPPQEILRQTFDVVNDTSSCRETCKTIENQVVPRVKGTVVGADANYSHGDNSLVSKDLMKYVQSQTCKTYQSKEHNTRLDSCLDDVCQTCNFQPKGPNEVIKNEEVTTQEVTLVFVWPKKMNIPRELTPKLPVSKPKEPFRSIHLRRVMRVSDFDVDVVETVEYRKDGSTRKSIVQRPAEKPDTKETQNSEYKKSDSKYIKQSDEICTQRGSIEKHQHLHSCEDIKRDDGSRDDKADAFAGETSQDKQINDDSNSLAEVELSHYDAVNESFVMPCLDMTTSQQSEELFDLSSAASMELLSETESSVEQIYSDHQRSVNAIYDRAENDSCCDGTEGDSTSSTHNAKNVSEAKIAEANSILNEFRNNRRATMYNEIARDSVQTQHGGRREQTISGLKTGSVLDKYLFGDEAAVSCKNSRITLMLPLKLTLDYNNLAILNSSTNCLTGGVVLLPLDLNPVLVGQIYYFDDNISKAKYSPHKQVAHPKHSFPRKWPDMEVDDFWEKYLFGPSPGEKRNRFPKMFDKLASSQSLEKVAPESVQNAVVNSGDKGQCTEGVLLKLTKPDQCKGKICRCLSFRKSDNVEGKDPNVKLIDQSERNVYVVSVGKYFAGKSDVPTDFADQPVSGENHPEVGSQETTCPRCENVYFVEEKKEIPKTRQQLSSDMDKKQHPVPCERCLRLEREIRIKLAELSKLIEELGRRKKLSKDDRSGSIEDLESLSQETAENIKILQRSIALLNDVGDDGTPDVMFDVSGDSINLNNVQDTQVTQPYSQRRVSPVSYSTRVIKKRKVKKVTKLREIFQDSLPSAQQETGEKNHVAVPITSPGVTQVFGMQLSNAEASALLCELPSTTDKNTWINGSQTGRDSVQSSIVDTSVDINSSLTNKIFVTEEGPSANTDTKESVKNVSEGDKNKLETFAENLAKYIIFRAKLFIVLENPATRIPYLKNELASPEGNGNNKPVGADHDRWVASDTKRQATSLVHGHNSGDSGNNIDINRNIPGTGVFTNTTFTNVGGSVLPVGCSPAPFSPDIKERVKQVAEIQARIEFNMLKIREKMAALKALKSLEEKPSLHVDFGRACLTGKGSISNDPGNVCNAPLENLSFSSLYENVLATENGSSCRCNCNDVKCLRPQLDSMMHFRSNDSKWESLEIEPDLAEGAHVDKSFDTCINLMDQTPSVDRNDSNLTNQAPSVGSCARNLSSDEQTVDVCKEDRKDNASSIDKPEKNVKDVDFGMLESAEKLRQVIRALSLDEEDSKECHGCHEPDANCTDISVDNDPREGGDTVDGSVTAGKRLSNDAGDIVVTGHSWDDNTGDTGLQSSLACDIHHSDEHCDDIMPVPCDDSESIVCCDIVSKVCIDDNIFHKNKEPADGRCNFNVCDGNICDDERCDDNTRSDSCDAQCDCLIVNTHQLNDSKLITYCEPTTCHAPVIDCGLNQDQTYFVGQELIPHQAMVSDDDHPAIYCSQMSDAERKTNRETTKSHKPIANTNKLFFDLESNGCHPTESDHELVTSLGSAEQKPVLDDESLAANKRLTESNKKQDQNQHRWSAPCQDSNYDNDPITNEPPAILWGEEKDRVKVKQILEFLDVYKYDAGLDAADDDSSVASSDLSDTSINTIIYVPVLKRNQLGVSVSSQNLSGALTPRSGQSVDSASKRERRSTSASADLNFLDKGNQDLSKHLKESVGRTRSTVYKQGCGLHGAPEKIQPTHLKHNVAHLSGLRHRMARVTPKGQYYSCQQRAAMSRTGVPPSNIRCIPLSRTRDTLSYGKSKARSAETIAVTRHASQRDCQNSKTMSNRSCDKHVSSTNNTIFVDCDEGLKGTTAKTHPTKRSISYETVRTKMSTDVLSVYGGFEEEPSKSFSSMREMFLVTEQCEHHDVHGVKGDWFTEDLNGSLCLHKSQSCDAIKSGNSATLIERGEYWSDPILRIQTQSDIFFRTRKNVAVGNTGVRCLTDGSGKSAATRTASSYVVTEDGSGGKRKPMTKFHGSTCSCLLTAAMLKRRWSEADLEGIKLSLDSRRVSGAVQCDSGEESPDVGLSGQLGGSDQDYAQLQPDFSTYVRLYAPYFEARRSRMPHQRSQIRVSWDSDATPSTERNSIALSPARSRYRTHKCKQVGTKKYPI
ncbi:hypothetical protein LSH36_610g01028 [Paralvinella palmiformis]|uniref:Uncharacterized protein n=1 Tax=Paralvinella palmiformis TaxID=53620 RepID=A0AAD9J4A8_9ANNE|nr:hypothetical protein LSH36_610g01028 [Paralvinella palmiformis]